LLAGEELPLNLTFMQDYENQAFLSGYLTSYTDAMRVLAGEAGGSASRFKEFIEGTNANAAPVDTITQSSDISDREIELDVRDTILSFFLLFSFIIGVGFARLLAEDRKNHTYARVKITGVRSVSYVSGLCLAGLASSLLMLLPVLIFWQVGGSGALLHVPEIAGLGILYMLFVIGFALVIGMFFNSSNAMVAALVAAATIINMLGGAFFPANMMPHFMQQIAHFMPPYWFMEAISSLNAAGESRHQWMPTIVADNIMLFSVIIIGAFAVLCYVAAGIRFAKRR
jgi:ABC-2 type transport system permease protein